MIIKIFCLQLQLPNQELLHWFLKTRQKIFSVKKPIQWEYLSLELFPHVQKGILSRWTQIITLHIVKNQSGSLWLNLNWSLMTGLMVLSWENNLKILSLVRGNLQFYLFFPFLALVVSLVHLQNIEMSSKYISSSQWIKLWIIQIMFLASSYDIQGHEIKPPNKIDLFLKMVVYNPKLILILIWIKHITEIQCEVIKSFDQHFDSNFWYSGKGEIQVRLTFVNSGSHVFLPKIEKGMKNI